MSSMLERLLGSKPQPFNRELFDRMKERYETLFNDEKLNEAGVEEMESLRSKLIAEIDKLDEQGQREEKTRWGLTKAGKAWSRSLGKFKLILEGQARGDYSEPPLSPDAESVVSSSEVPATPSTMLSDPASADVLSQASVILSDPLNQALPDERVAKIVSKVNASPARDAIISRLPISEEVKQELFATPQKMREEAAAPYQLVPVEAEPPVMPPLSVVSRTDFSKIKYSEMTLDQIREYQAMLDAVPEEVVRAEQAFDPATIADTNLRTRTILNRTQYADDGITPIGGGFRYRDPATEEERFQDVGGYEMDEWENRYMASLRLNGNMYVVDHMDQPEIEESPFAIESVRVPRGPKADMTVDDDHWRYKGLARQPWDDFQPALPLLRTVPDDPWRELGL